MIPFLIFTAFLSLTLFCVMAAFSYVRYTSVTSWPKWDTFQRWSLVLLWALVPLYPTGALLTLALERYEHARFLDIAGVRSDCQFKAMVWPLYVPLRLTLMPGHPWEQL
jgi:hypothetical protein